MKVRYLPVFGRFEVTPTTTTENGRNTDRDALGKAMATVMPLAQTPNAPCCEAAKRLVEAAKEIIQWIEETNKKSEQPKPPTSSAPRDQK